MKQLQKIIVLCAALVLAACAAKRPPLPEVKIPPERMLQNGYSVMPLNENGWVVVARNAYQFSLAKPGENPDETFAIRAMLSRIDTFNTTEDFVQQIKEGQIKDTSPPRFKLLTHDITPFPKPGIDCVKSHMITEDNAAVTRSGGTAEMILEALTLSCAHPDEKSVAIHVIYSHRHYPGTQDTAFMEKGTAVLDSVDFFAPEQPYITQEEKASDTLAINFSTSCSEVISQPLPPKDGELQDGNMKALEKLSSMGISIGRESSGRKIGSYALFKKEADGSYALSAIQPSYIVPTDITNQEVLFVSPKLDNIAPAFAKQRFNDVNQAFVCETGTKFVTGIDSSYRAYYNPCDSSLTSSSGKAGAAVLANSLLTVLSLGTNVVTGSSIYYVNTDKDKVAKLVVDSKLFQCLKKAKNTN